MGVVNFLTLSYVFRGAERIESPLLKIRVGRPIFGHFIVFFLRFLIFKDIKNHPKCFIMRAINETLFKTLLQVISQKPGF